MTENKKNTGSEPQKPETATPSQAGNDTVPAASQARKTTSSRRQKAVADKNSTAAGGNTADKNPRQTDAPPAAKENGKKGGSKLGAIAIVLVFALGGGLYYHGHQQSTTYQTQIAALSDQVGELGSALTAAETRGSDALVAAQQESRTLIDQQQKTITSLQNALADVKGRRPNDWLLAEADYLVKQAGRKLWLEHDALTATTLMESADQRISELNDPALTPLRQALAADITKLKAVKRIDRDGLVLRLSSLQQQVDSLPLANAIMPEAEETATQAVSGSVDDWQQNLKTSMGDFVNQFITYRKREGNVIPLLTPVQTFYVQENLKAKLDQAINAVYREQGRLFSESVQSANDLAGRFFNLEDPAAASFVDSLGQLGDQTVTVVYPEKLDSQSLISDLIAQRLHRDVAPLPSGENTL